MVTQGTPLDDNKAEGEGVPTGHVEKVNGEVGPHRQRKTTTSGRDKRRAGGGSAHWLGDVPQERQQVHRVNKGTGLGVPVSTEEGGD